MCMSMQISDLQEKLAEAVKLHQSGELKAAQALYEAIIAEDADFQPALYNLASLYRHVKLYDKSIAIYQKLITLRKDDPNLYNNLAITYEAMGDFENALLLYQKAVETDSSFAKAYNNIAVLLHKQKRYADGAAVLELALEYVGEDTQTLSNLGAFYNKTKRYEDARKVLERALKIDPNLTGAYVNLGNVYNKLHRHMDALACHVKALELDPGSATNYANLAITYKHLERYDDAIENFQKALHLEPEFVNAHFDLATTYLLLNDYENGFREYEWRFYKEEMQSLLRQHSYIFEKPKFQFDLPTEGKTLLLYSEQGYGDIIQFIRFAEPLKKVYPQLRLKVQCREELKTLLQTIPFLDEVVTRDEEVGAFDYQYAIMSLPYLLDIQYDDIPDSSYIKVDGGEKVSLELHPYKYNIGVVWGASTTGEGYHEKIFPLQNLSALMHHEDIALYSLQVGPDADMIHKLGLSNEEIVDLSDQLVDFQATASVIEKLDLVITSDTSVAHLAGAMGKEVWILLIKKADWRWGLDSEKSRWYPSARLFRQKKQGEWQDVFEAVLNALEEKYYIEIPRNEDA